MVLGYFYGPSLLLQIQRLSLLFVYDLIKQLFTFLSIFQTKVLQFKSLLSVIVIVLIFYFLNFILAGLQGYFMTKQLITRRLIMIMIISANYYAFHYINTQECKDMTLYTQIQHYAFWL